MLDPPGAYAPGGSHFGAILTDRLLKRPVAVPVEAADV
jgi:hypothetical protein